MTIDFDDFDTQVSHEELGQEYADYLDALAHEENSRALDFHLEGAVDVKQVKEWY